MKRLVVVVVLGVLSVAATGCDVSPPAATVNGVTISQSQLNGVLSAVLTNTDAQCAAQLQAGLTESPVGVGTEGNGSTPNAVTPSFAASTLGSLVIEQLEQQTLAAHGVKVTAADIAAATTDYENQLVDQLQEEESQSAAPSGCTLSATLPVARQLPASFLRRQGTSLADEEQLEMAVGHFSLGTAALESYYRSHLAEVTQECLNLIVASTSADAQALWGQIVGGASFATASKSPDADADATPTDGELSCAYPSQLESQLGSTLGTTIDDLRSGQLAPPLTWQTTNSTTGQAVTYYLVVQMRQHVIVPFSTLRSAIREAILQNHSTQASTALKHLADRARISVDPRYGTWTASGVRVPTPPPSAFVPNPKANVPAQPLSLGGLGVSPTG